MNAIRYRIFLGLALAPTMGDALAHHSHSMFDHTRTVTISGTVGNISYRNPHVYFWIDAVDENGQAQTWSVEMSNIQNMIRRGIGGGTFEIGDRVSVTLNPLLNGNPGGNYVTIIDADGRPYE